MTNDDSLMQPINTVNLSQLASVSCEEPLTNALRESRGERWKPHQLCAVCSHILASTTTSTYAYQKTARDIRDAAYAGCHVCSMVHGSFPLVKREASQPSSAVRSDGPWHAEIKFDEKSDLTRFELTVHIPQKRSSSFNLELDGVEVRPFDPGDAGTAEEDSKDLSLFSDSTGSNESLETAKRWLRSCLDCHDDVCGAYSSHRILPTRLLEVGDEELCLRECKTLRQDLRYLILSYCWGEERKDELKLTQQNITQLLKGIDFTRLPQTVADAVLTTKKLGYRYLWIDRLCIIQDSHSDWLFESGRVQAYYMLADCCIAALVAEDAYQGMYVKRNPLLMQPFRFTHSQLGKLFNVTSRKIGGYGHYPQMYRGPPYALSERAWVLQERLLAPRTLFYGSLMLYWECRSKRFAEHTPDKDLDLPFASLLRKLGSRGAQSSVGHKERIGSNASGEEDLWKVPSDDASLDRSQDLWGDVVEYYSKCSMKYPEKDRIVAITGIIKTVSVHAGLQFVHGLLHSRLATEVLWWQSIRSFDDEKRGPVRLGHKTGSPTWSWASVKGYVVPFWSYRFFQLERREPWEIEIAATTEALDPSVMPQMKCMTTATSDQVCQIVCEAPLIEAYIVDRMDKVYYCWEVRAVGQTGKDAFLTFDVRMWADEPVRKGQSVWLLRAARKPGKTKKSVHFSGLVIAPVTNEQPHYWTRTGYWHCKSGVQPLENPSEEERSMARRTALLGTIVGRPAVIRLL